MAGSSRKIEVVSYNTDWPGIFEAEAKKIKEALGNNCITIHHIGSTSVPGLAAKPIIDMIPVVQDITAVDSSNVNMQKLGYDIKGEFGFFLRRFFVKNNAFHIHVFEYGNPEIDRHLNFRHWMRTHPDDKQQYEDLKKDLASQFSNDSTSYCIGKDEFIAEIDEKAGWRRVRVVKAFTDQEWETIKRYRRTYFFDKFSTKDPYTWTFDDEEHVHFVAYKKANIIGYVHLQLWPKYRAVIRIFMIDENKQGQAFEDQFIALIEKWLKSQEYKNIYTDSPPEVLPFYKKHGYTKMPFNDPDTFKSSSEDISIGKLL